MVTEYIKRNQKMGFDETGKLVYKIPVEDATPVVEEAPVVEDVAPIVEDTPAEGE